MTGPNAATRPSRWGLLKVVFTICFAVLAVVVLVVFFVKTEVAFLLTTLAALLAGALDHLVVKLERVGLRRSAAIVVVIAAVLVVLTTLALLVIPAALGQAEALLAQVPDYLARLRASHLVQLLRERFHVPAQWEQLGSSAPETATAALPPLLRVVSGAVNLLGALLTVWFLAVFMLFFGPGLLQRLLALATPSHRAHYTRVLAKVYTATGGYLGGLMVICAINATLTSTALALLRMPFFLPLGIASGFSSMVPYAGPVLAGITITLLTLAAGGLWKALAVAVYFLVYGPLEGNVLAPLVFRRTVHVNPLITLLAILFFADLEGIIGAVVAVPVAATLQIIGRELLRLREERLGERAAAP